MVLIEREIRDIAKQVSGLYGRKKLLEDEAEKLWRVITIRARSGEFPFMKEAEE